MAFCADFTLGFLLTQRTILKSLSLLCTLHNFAHLLYCRILLANIRNLGGCPCPRCTIPLSSVPLVGTKRDRNDRIKLARVDDPRYRKLVSQARRAIYQQNFAVDSAPVERMLKPESFVPTSVSDPSRPPGGCEV
jgi:hypothetical protein